MSRSYPSPNIILASRDMALCYGEDDDDREVKNAVSKVTGTEVEQRETA